MRRAVGRNRPAIPQATSSWQCICPLSIELLLHPRVELLRYITLTRSTKMNQDQIKGNIKEAAGQVQRKVGEAIDSDKQRVKGTEKEVEGKVQKDVGNVKDTFSK